MAQPRLTRFGVVVNRLKGDPAGTRPNPMMGVDGGWRLDATFLGVPYDGASVVRGGSRSAPDSVREAIAHYTAYSTEDAVAINGYKVADIGDVDVILTDAPREAATRGRRARGSGPKAPSRASGRAQRGH